MPAVHAVYILDKRPPHSKFGLSFHNYSVKTCVAWSSMKNKIAALDYLSCNHEKLFVISSLQDSFLPYQIGIQLPHPRLNVKSLVSAQVEPEQGSTATAEMYRTPILLFCNTSAISGPPHVPKRQATMSASVGWSLLLHMKVGLGSLLLAAPASVSDEPGQICHDWHESSLLLTHPGSALPRLRALVKVLDSSERIAAISAFWQRMDRDIAQTSPWLIGQAKCRMVYQHLLKRTPGFWRISLRGLCSWPLAWNAGI